MDARGNATPGWSDGVSSRKRSWRFQTLEAEGASLTTHLSRFKLWRRPCWDENNRFIYICRILMFFIPGTTPQPLTHQKHITNKLSFHRAQICLLALVGPIPASEPLRRQVWAASEMKNDLMWLDVMINTLWEYYQALNNVYFRRRRSAGAADEALSGARRWWGGRAEEERRRGAEWKKSCFFVRSSWC